MKGKKRVILLSALLALTALGAGRTYAEGEKVMIWKHLDQHNPVMVQRFGADPWAMVYGDRVYLYMTGDEPVYLAGGKVKTNDYGNIRSLRVISSEDLVNWTDHGSVNAAGPKGAAKWAGNSWAPCAAWKNIDGRDRFFLYFANSGGGIGVLTADSPTGPFTDPLGKPLVSRRTPTCAEVTWLFDPAVLVDDDGQGYLYFGGGIPAGKEAAPGTARVVKLGADMISLDGDPVRIDPPWLFEDSGINKIGDTYVYSYCSNFNVPQKGSEYGFYSGEIVYMTSDSPMGPFVFGGRVLKNPGAYFGVGGNNHHCMFSFRDKWYITYHAATLDKDKKWNAGYRSTFVDDLVLGENGLPALSKGTKTGVKQLLPFDPYRENDAAAMASIAGAKTELEDPSDTAAGTGKMKVCSTRARGWTAVSAAAFGEKGAKALELKCRGPVGAKILLLTDEPQSEPMGTAVLSSADAWETVTLELTGALQGTHDLYICFEQPGIELSSWRAVPET